MDLPYLYNPDGKDLIAAQKPPTPSFMSQYLMMFMFSGLRNTTTKSRPRDIVKYRRTHPARRSIQADVFCFSGCRDDQLSMDVCDGKCVCMLVISAFKSFSNRRHRMLRSNESILDFLFEEKYQADLSRTLSCCSTSAQKQRIQSNRLSILQPKTGP